MKREKRANNKNGINETNEKFKENPLYDWLRRCRLNNNNLSIDQLCPKLEETKKKYRIKFHLDRRSE